MVFENLINKLEKLPSDDFATYETFDEILKVDDFDFDTQFADDGIFDSDGLADFIEHGFIERYSSELESIQDDAKESIRLGRAGDWSVYRYHELKDIIQFDENRIKRINSTDGVYWLDYDSENDYRLTNRDLTDYLKRVVSVK